MKSINWIIVRSKDRGSEYGVGTFVKHFCEGLKQQPHIRIIILKTGTPFVDEFSSYTQDGILYMQFPNMGLDKLHDTLSNQVKIGRSIARLVKLHLPPADENIIHLQFAYQYFVAKEITELIKSKVIFTLHIAPPEDVAVSNNFDLDKHLFKLADHIVSVTDNGYNHLLKKGAPPEKITRIYNGISTDYFKNKNNTDAVLAKYDLDKHDKIILYSGRIDSLKGINQLVKAFTIITKKYPDCKLVFAGNGSFEKLIGYAQPVSSKVIYLGFIPTEDLLVLYQQATIGVIPSLNEECSYVALEMLFSGLPTIASKIGGLKEIFDHNKDGLLVNVQTSNPEQPLKQDIEKLADAMSHLLTNRDLCRRLSIKAQQKAARQFTAEIMIDNYIQLLNTQTTYGN
ncbi:glycosyltransferase family 1 protein [Puteibacter caeruleilacunae]|nr:glycosyltransferase family 1 protein [Puteibacter caeruleilacunae]